jgi:hypothetical protein
MAGGAAQGEGPEFKLSTTKIKPKNQKRMDAVFSG